MRYLTAGDVLRIHEAEVSSRPIVDVGLLESAVLRPMETVGGRDAYPDVHAKAAALFHSLIRNHPFVDGNKRTAVLSLVVFYNLNGFDLVLRRERPLLQGGEGPGLEVDEGGGHRAGGRSPSPPGELRGVEPDQAGHPVEGPVGRHDPLG